MPHQHRQGVGPQPVERAVPERDQAGLARDQVEAENGDGVRRGEGELIGPEAPQHEGEHDRARGDGHHDEAARIRGADAGISRRRRASLSRLSFHFLAHQLLYGDNMMKLLR